MSKELLSALPLLQSLEHLGLTSCPNRPDPGSRHAPIFKDHLDRILACPKLKSIDFSYTGTDYNVVSPGQETIALPS